MLYEIRMRRSDGSFHRLLFDSETWQLTNADDGTLFLFDAPKKKLVVRVPERIKLILKG